MSKNGKGDMSEHDQRVHDAAVADRNSRLLYEIRADLGRIEEMVKVILEKLGQLPASG